MAHQERVVREAVRKKVVTTMPTTEERLAALEQANRENKQFQDQAIRHLRELDASTTILLGVIQAQGRDIRLIFERLDTIDSRLAEQSRELASHTVLLQQILAKLP